ncbi:MAG: hypothetical protein H6585_15545 [Flavobacteriales bacterium]|nr:hypothetical protein [Flavobacteriales bacterium]MCB9449745.1 hypothetical protein [Flavobacteriales bacterium]
MYRKIALLICMAACLAGGMVHAGTSADSTRAKEYLILKVEYRIKSQGMVDRLEVNLGDQFPNSLSGILENGEEGTIQVNNYQGKKLVLRNEVDFLSYIQSLGWRMISVAPVRAMDRDYTRYLFEKSK